MFTARRLGLVVFLGAAVGVSACGEGSAAEQAPDAIETIETTDVGTTYDGWTQSPSGTVYVNMGFGTVEHTLTRSYGDSTRGGGACYVLRQPGSSCSVDDTCKAAAQSAYGSQASGYCYGGECYDRFFSQAEGCKLNSNRSPGTLSGNWYATTLGFATGNEFVLGCLSKAVGTATPPFPCAGSDPDLYMRTIVPAAISFDTW
jgi:hypothetical protein